MSFKLSNRSIERLSGIDKSLFDIITTAIKLTPIDFCIPEYGGKRTATEQRMLFDRNVSKCDGIDIKSKHQSGRAFDVYAHLPGYASWDDVHLAIIAGVILAVAKQKGVDIRWGGTFGSKSFQGWDKGHFELK